MTATHGGFLNHSCEDYFGLVGRMQPYATPNAKLSQSSDLSKLLHERTMQLKQTVRSNRNQQYLRSMHITSSSRQMEAYRQ